MASRVHILIFAVFSALISTGTAHGQNGVFSLIPVGAGNTTVESGKVGTVVFRLGNASSERARVRLVVDLPDGWSPLIPPSALTLDAGHSENQLLTFRIPRSAPSEEYELYARMKSDAGILLARARVQVTVLPRFGVDVAILTQPQRMAAGDPYEVLFHVTNTGNTTTTAEISASSSLLYPVLHQEMLLVLEPGESRQIPVSVQTSTSLLNRQMHQTTLIVRISDSGDEYRGISAVDLVPRAANLIPEHKTGIPIFLSASGYSEGGSAGRQFEAEIRQTRIGDKTVDLLLRVPDLRATSSFADRDMYSLGIEAPAWEIKAGDHSYPLTDLTETGRNGLGGSARRKWGQLEIGGHAHTSRHVFPEEDQVAGFVNIDVSKAMNVGINYLGRRRFEEGDIVSLTTAVAPRIGTTIKTEYARGRFQEETDDALSVSVASQSKRLTLAARYLSAGEYFLGAVKNVDSGTASMNMSPWDWLRIQGQYRVQRRFFRVPQVGRIAQADEYIRAGTGLTHTFDRKRIWMMSFLRLRRQDNPVTGLNRREEALEIRAGLNLRRVGITAQYHSGRTKDLRTQGNVVFWKGGISVYGSTRGFSFSATSEFTSGPTFYNPVPQERLALGASVSVEPVDGLRASLNVFSSRDRLYDDQSFRLVDGLIEYRLPFGHKITIQGRLADTGVDRTIRSSTIGISYSVPLSLNLFSTGSGRLLTGRIYDLETGLGIPDAVISLGRTAVLTDEFGEFKLPRPTIGTEYLSVDRQSIGLDRVTLEEMPMAVSANDPTLLSLDLAVVPSSVIRAEVVYRPEGEADQSSALADTIEIGPQAGVVLEVTNGVQRTRRVTDSAGRATFPDLVPGEWRVFAIESRVPEGYRADPDTTRLALGPGSDRSLTINFVPLHRAIQFVGGQSISLTKGDPPLRTAPPPGLQKPEQADPDQANEPAVPEPGAVRADSTPVDSTQARSPADSTSLQKPPDTTSVIRHAESYPDERPSNALEEADRMAARVPVGEGESTHVVLPGETLSSLARQYFGRTIMWVRIWLRNAAELPQPDHLLPGTTLVIASPGSLSERERAALVDYAARR